MHDRFRGTADSIRDEVMAYLHSSCADLENSVRALEEFSLRSTQYRHATAGEIAVLADRLRQSSTEMAECLRTLTDCRRKLEALRADGFGGSELGELAHRAATTLESSQVVTAAAARALATG